VALHPCSGHAECSSCLAPGLLIAAGADVNVVDDDGETALILACGYDPSNRRFNHGECARDLIAAGANVNASEPQGGKTALTVACASGWKECTSALIAAGADLSMPDDSQGNTQHE
jgi:ankyrin repeat protein